MKKLLTVFTLLLLSISCTKEVDISQSEMSGETVKFTASMVDMTATRATLINSWAGGEEVALFVGDAIYLYTIAADGVMSGDDIIIDREESIIYKAFYPYDSNLTTITEYESACSAGNMDYMSATTTTSGKAVDLQFSHSMAAISFTVIIDGTATNPAISLALDGNFNSAAALEVVQTTENSDTKLVANYFVTDGTDISSAMIKLEYSDTTTFHSIVQGNTDMLKAGKQYQFTL